MGCGVLDTIAASPAPGRITLATPDPNAPPAPATLRPAASAVPAQPNWQRVNPAIELITLTARPKDAQSDQSVMIARIDPARAEFKVQYAPDGAQTVREWQTATQADLTINAGYFTEQHLATGLIIANGRASGTSYAGFGGMFSIADGRPALQWLAKKPYAADRRISSAVQSFPMLINNGGLVPGIPADARPSFRTFVGLDKQGRVILGVCQSPTWTMIELAEWLAAQPALNLDTALNLDGGRSTGLWIRGIDESRLTNSFDVVPAVIAVKAKG